MGAAVEAVEHGLGTPEIEGMAVLALQRDPDIFQRGQMRKHRRNLERAHQAKTRHIGRRQRRDILSLVEDLARRGLQELGQEIEARGLAGPVRTDQRMNAATADPEIDIANGKEPREFLGQSVGFENELIGQSNFPHQPSPRSPLARGQFFRPAGSPGRLGNPVPDRPPPGRNMPSTARFTQGGKLGISGRADARPDAPLVEWPTGTYRPVAGGFGSPSRPPGKQPLTVFRCNLTFSPKICRSRPMIWCFASRSDCRLGIRKRQPIGRQIDQAAGSAEHLAAALCPRAADAAHRGIPARAARRRTSGPRLLYRRTPARRRRA